jgi:hypothetical protein
VLTIYLSKAVQAFVAALGLNWSIVPAIDPSSHVPGAVRYSDMSQYYFSDGEYSTSANQAMAHLVCESGAIVTEKETYAKPESVR